MCDFHHYTWFALSLFSFFVILFKMTNQRHISIIELPTVFPPVFKGGLFHFKNFMLYVLITRIIRVWTFYFGNLHTLFRVCSHSQRNISIVHFPKNIMWMIARFFRAAISKLISHLIFTFLISHQNPHFLKQSKKAPEECRILLRP